MEKGKKRLIFGLLSIAVAVFCLVGLTGCLNNEPLEKSFTISCPTEMDAGDRIEIIINKSYEFEMKHDDYEWIIVGENTVDGSFEFEDLKKNDNYTNKFFRANLPGKVTIQATNSTSELLTSNTVEITVTANMINTVGELKAIANSKKSYLLGTDIDLASEGNWTPIDGFSGTLNGAGHSIKNLSLTVRSSDNVGLFSELKGTVNNIKMTAVNISGSGSGNNVGAITGKNSGTIKNSEVNGSINCQYATCVGGIAGYSNTKLYNNVNNASVSSNEKVGGVVGRIVINGASEIKINTNNGTVNGASYVGGIAGVMESKKPSDGGTYTTTISDCENNGSITATGDYVGGIAGQANGMYKDSWTNIYLEISDCENKGIVVGKDYAGGIYGYGGSYVRSVTACVNNVDIVGNNYVGGYIGYSKNTSTQNMNNDNKITGKGYVGGIAGYTGNVKNCINNGTIISLGTILEDGINKYCVGGIAGYCSGATNCTNNANLTLDLDGRRVGGIAGEIYCSNSIENNSNTGTIKALQSSSVGGIGGKIIVNGNRIIKGNRNEATISGETYVGGVVGIIESKTPSDSGTYTTMISDCENNGSITATGDYVGGIAGHAAGTYKYDWIDIYVYLEISNNTNSKSVFGGSSETRAAIVGKIGNYVNSRNSSLWTSNNDSGSVGKLYN